MKLSAIVPLVVSCVSCSQPLDSQPPDSQPPDSQLPDSQLPDSQLPDSQLPDSQPADSEPVAVPQHVQFAPAATWGICVLSWAAPSDPVDGYYIAVNTSLWQFVDPSLFTGIPGQTASVELNFGSWNPELTEVSVAIRSRRGAQFSDYSMSVSCKLPIKPVSEFIAVVASGGVDLGWSSTSQLGTSFQIERSELDAARQPRAWATLAAVPKMPFWPWASRRSRRRAAHGEAVALRAARAAPRP